MTLDATRIALIDAGISEQSEGRHTLDDIQSVSVMKIPGRDTRDGFPRFHLMVNLPDWSMIVLSTNHARGRQAAIVQAGEIADALGVPLVEYFGE